MNGAVIRREEHRDLSPRRFLQHAEQRRALEPLARDLSQGDLVARDFVQNLGFAAPVGEEIHEVEHERTDSLRADSGAEIFAQTIREIRRQSPSTTVEVLIPDFVGRPESLDAVLAARPEILTHNVETVPRLYPRVRPQARYERSLEVLHRTKQRAPDLVCKSGIMVGLGETRDEVIATMRDIASQGTDILTVGQYLRPSPVHLPIERYWTPAEFDDLRDAGLTMGFEHVEAGPLVRSSYHAERHVRR